jgi:hypothetical protein
MDRKGKAVAKVVLEALCKRFSVTVFAPRTDLRAACRRIPGLVRPLNGCTRAGHSP